MDEELSSLSLTAKAGRPLPPLKTYPSAISAGADRVQGTHFSVIHRRAVAHPVSGHAGVFTKKQSQQFVNYCIADQGIYTKKCGCGLSILIQSQQCPPSQRVLPPAVHWTELLPLQSSAQARKLKAQTRKSSPDKMSRRWCLISEHDFRTWKCTWKWLNACVLVWPYFRQKNPAMARARNPLGMEAFREKENMNKATMAVISHMKEITQR